MSVDWESFTDKTAETAEVRLLGLADLTSVLALQKLMVHEVRQQSRLCAAVLICEHPPAITQGLGSNLLDLPADPRELEAKLISVQRVSRYGGTLLHQPGQLAIYVIVSLNERDFGENEFRWRLQDAIIRACQESQVNARRESGNLTTVHGRQGVICEIATGLDQGVTSFGAFLNVSCCLDEASQYGRGLRGERISSLNAERVRPTIMSQVRASLISHVCEQIGYPEYHIHTGHPFLKRQRPGQTRDNHSEPLLD
jgi:lipoyl(octanoyl) transferase